MSPGLHYFSTKVEQKEDFGQVQEGSRCCLCKKQLGNHAEDFETKIDGR